MLLTIVIMSHNIIFQQIKILVSQVLRGHTRSNELLADYCDGSYYSTHPPHKQNAQALQLIVYYDDVC